LGVAIFRTGTPLAALSMLAGPVGLMAAATAGAIGCQTRVLMISQLMARWENFTGREVLSIIVIS
jgi:predicted flavoprotein YhiN